MPTDKLENERNAGHERKRKRIDDKITKSGGKRPRRCDKEPTKKYISPYFQGIQDNTTNIYQIRQEDVSHAAKIEPITSSKTTRGLTNVTNLPHRMLLPLQIVLKLFAFSHQYMLDVHHNDLVK